MNTVSASTSEPTTAFRAANDARAALEKSNKARGAQFALTTRPARHVEASLVFAAVTPKLTVEEWMIYIAQPPELPGRQDKFKFEANPEAKTVTEPEGLKRPLLFWDIPADEKKKNTIAVGVTFQLDLHARKLIASTNAGNVAAITGQEREFYTQSSPLLDFTAGSLQEWLAKNALRPKPGETDIELARRIFLHIKEKAAFDYKPEIERRASGVCTSMKSVSRRFSVWSSDIREVAGL